MRPDRVIRLYDYFRSSSAYRVRIALNMKGLSYESLPRHLRRGGGEHLAPDYLAINPQALVPSLQVDGESFSQSLAIIEWLEETFPEPPLLPEDPARRAQVRSAALHIACDIHPLNNLRVLQYLRSAFGLKEDAIARWCAHWITRGFNALEEQVRGSGSQGEYMFGHSATLADVCLVPQMYSARRFGCDVTPYPTLCSISEHLESLNAFAAAAPERQPDAE